VRQSIDLEENAEARMRDGTILRADIFRPAGDGPFPVLISRTPYDKTRPVYRQAARFMAEHGYICVLQDIRGTNQSDGDFHMARNGRQLTCDAEDGHDSVEWAAALPGSNGKVCIWGHSYASWASWVAAPTRPPHLTALFGSGMAAKILNNTRGIFETGRRMHWMYRQAASERQRAGGGKVASRDEIDAAWYDVERFKWIWSLPLGDIPDTAFATLTPQLKQYMRMQDVESWAFDEVHPDVAVPTCSVTGWYDRIIGAIEQYEGMEANGPRELRGQHRLIVGPWGHGMGNLTRRQGPMDFGPEADALYEALLLDWCDLHLKGKSSSDKPPVRLFIMGENRWQYEHEWPLARTRYTDFFLRSGGRANSVSGDGRLTLAPSEDEASDNYVYDPKDPVMSLMGKDVQMEPRFQAPLDDRQDILVYQTAPLSEDIQVIGPVSLKLWVSTDAPDTDFTAKLIDVFPDGSAVNVTYGILRCQYRDGFAVTAPPMQPGEVYALEVALNPTGIVFKKGHRIRLDISSSDFPNFDRNHNTGRDFWSDAELRPARQTVFHDHARPSRLVLPVIPR
jgi:putative CocE/NonD family hydrolase